jgi:hypothetical protein
VSLDELQEKIAEIEDFVQSTDVAAMQSTFLVASAVPCTETFLFRAVDGPRFISMVSSFWVLCEGAFGCICIILRGKSSLLVHTLCSTMSSRSRTTVRIKDDVPHWDCYTWRRVPPRPFSFGQFHLFLCLLSAHAPTEQTTECSRPSFSSLYEHLSPRYLTSVSKRTPRMYAAPRISLDAPSSPLILDYQFRRLSGATHASYFGTSAIKYRLTATREEGI